MVQRQGSGCQPASEMVTLGCGLFNHELSVGHADQRLGRLPDRCTDPVYTHVSDQHGSYSVRVMSATSNEAPYVLDGLMHHGTGLRIRAG